MNKATWRHGTNKAALSMSKGCITTRRKDWGRGVGIRESLDFKFLMYNEPSRKLIVYLDSPKEASAPRSALFIRHAAEKKYRRLVSTKRKSTIEYPVCSSTRPRLYYQYYEWTKSP